MAEQTLQMAEKRYPILNTYVNALSMQETVAYVEDVIRRRTPPVQHVVINALKVNLMESDPELRKIERLPAHQCGRRVHPLGRQKAGHPADRAGHRHRPVSGAGKDRRRKGL